MPDVLIPDVPESVVARLDEHARQAGLSRSELLQGVLASQASRRSSPVTLADLERFATSCGDLNDEAVMDQAWRCSER